MNKYIKKIRFKGDISGMNFHIGCAVIIRVNATEFRNYSPSFIDLELGILEIIFHLHGSGPGSNLMENINVGTRLRISAPRGQKQYDPTASQYIVFGDETTLGLAVSFQLELKRNSHQFQFFFELDETNVDIPKVLGLDNVSVFRKKEIFKNEEMIANLPFFKTNKWKTSNFVLTGNVKSMQNFKKVLKSHGFIGKIMTQGYWLEGKTGL